MRLSLGKWVDHYIINLIPRFPSYSSLNKKNAGNEVTNTCMSLFWISNAVVSLSEEKAMLLSVLYYSNCICDFPCCCHSFNPFSCHLSTFHLSYVIFQGHVDCRNFTQTRSLKILLDYNNLSYLFLCCYLHCLYGIEKWMFIHYGTIPMFMKRKWHTQFYVRLQSFLQNQNPSSLFG